MGSESSSGHRAGTTDQNIPDESDLAQQIQGKNALQGNDQRNRRNERGRMAEETTRTEGVVESFENMDPRRRAEQRRRDRAK
jgi:hypothetical protein